MSPAGEVAKVQVQEREQHSTWGYAAGLNVERSPDQGVAKKAAQKWAKVRPENPVEASYA
jgi:hypothetical protein